MNTNKKSNSVDSRKPSPVGSVECNYLDLDSINPKKSDKYSPNLHKYLKLNSVVATLGRVYRDAGGVLWLGYEDDPFMCVTRLMEVLCQGVKASSAAFIDLGELNVVEDFWPRYLEVGRCAIDSTHSNHFLEGSRYVEHGESRECLWCGQHQKLHKFKVEVEREEWRDATTPEMAENSLK